MRSGRRPWLSSGSERGVTLVETLMAIGIMTMALGMVGGPLYGVLAADDKWRDEVSATVSWRQAGASVAKDGVNAETTSLADGAEPVATATFGWTDTTATPHAASYAIAGSTLVRTLDGVPLVVARRVVDVAFSRSGALMTFLIEVDAAAGSTKAATTSAFMRNLQ